MLAAAVDGTPAGAAVCNSSPTMKLIVCWTTRKLGAHPCGVAYEALRDAGHDPQVVKSYGWRVLPTVFNLTPGRREAKRLTGDVTVPVLVTDDGEVVHESHRIAEWARGNPAPSAASAARAGA